MRRISLARMVLPLVLIPATAPIAAPGATARARAVLRTPAGAVRGIVVVTEQSGGTLNDRRIDVIGTVDGLSPGAHGLHLRGGTCASPGPHVDFSHEPNAALTHPRDEGDLANIVAGPSGRASIHLTGATTRFSITTDPSQNLFYRQGGPVVVAIDASPATASSFDAAPILCGQLVCESGGCDDTAAPPPQIVISEVYGAGGNAGASLRNDYIELHNIGGLPQSLSGWSVQYAAAASASWSTTALPSVILPPGGRFLVQQSSGGSNGALLPSPDATGTIAMAAGAGKVALVSSTTTALSGTCPLGGSVVDFVGYGATANCFEGAEPTGAPSTTACAQRACADSNDNGADFTVTAPDPENSAAAPSFCN